MSDEEREWWCERMVLRREQMKKDLTAAKIEQEKHLEELVSQARENQEKLEGTGTASRLDPNRVSNLEAMMGLDKDGGDIEIPGLPTTLVHG